MEGVFVNLTNNDINFKDSNNKLSTIQKIDSLKSSYSFENNSNNSKPGPDNTKIQGQSGTELFTFPKSSFKVLKKDHFSGKQIERINSMCNNHTRLLIMNMEEAVAWCAPNSEYIIPFTRYRIFVPQYLDNGGSGDRYVENFIEFQKPDNLLGSAVKYLKNKKTEIMNHVEDFSTVSGTPPTGGMSIS